MKKLIDSFWLSEVKFYRNIVPKKKYGAQKKKRLCFQRTTGLTPSLAISITAQFTSGQLTSLFLGFM